MTDPDELEQVDSPPAGEPAESSDGPPREASEEPDDDQPESGPAEVPGDPDEAERRLNELHQAKLTARASAPNWTMRIGVLTFVVIPLLIWALPRLIVVDEREERGLERALHYCDNSELDRCRERVTERHTFCFEYAEQKRAKDKWTDFYGDCMHSMYGDFYLRVGDNILEK